MGVKKQNKKPTVKQKAEHTKEIAKIAEPEAFELTADNNSYIDKLDKKKALFVDFYTRLNGNISDTCAAVPISRQTYYDWLEKDEMFRNAIIEAESGLNDTIREVLINKAASGDMTAVIFYLKNRHPDFKPQPTTLIQNNFGEFAKKELKEFE